MTFLQYNLSQLLTFFIEKYKIIQKLSKFIMAISNMPKKFMEVFLEPIFCLYSKGSVYTLT